MLDSHEDAYAVAGRSNKVPAGEVLPSNVPKVKAILVNVQTEKSDVERCSASILQDCFEEDYSLPELPLKSLLTHLDINGRLRERGQVRDLLGFESSSHLERQILEDDACPVPYFIPEVELYCARAEAGQLKELALAAVEEQTAWEVEVLKLKDTRPTQIEEISVPRIEEPNVLEVEEAQLPEIKEALSIEFEDINLQNLKGPDATEMTEPLGLQNAEVENTSEQLVKIPMIEEPISPHSVVQEPIQIMEPMAPVIENAMPSRGTGLINSLIGSKPIWRPSARLCFGDKERRWTQREEEIKRQTSKALKSLILYINLYKKFKESSQEKSKPSQSGRSRCKLIHSRVTRIIRQEELPEKALACGEPNQRNPVMYPERIRVLYKLDASDGWARNAPDSDLSDSCDSEDSGIKTTLSVMDYSRDMKIPYPIADRQDIESSGRILFSKPVTLFRFNSVNQWQREGILPGPQEHPYTGDIKILERHGLYYILLREKSSGFLLVYTRIDGNWHVGYMANRTNSCGWFNFNYAFCPEGTPEHFACTFQEPSHAAEFVARVRNLVIKARFLNLPRS